MQSNRCIYQSAVSDCIILWLPVACWRCGECALVALDQLEADRWEMINCQWSMVSDQWSMSKYKYRHEYRHKYCSRWHIMMTFCEGWFMLKTCEICNERRRPLLRWLFITLLLLPVDLKAVPFTSWWGDYAHCTLPSRIETLVLTEG